MWLVFAEKSVHSVGECGKHTEYIFKGPPLLVYDNRVALEAYMEHVRKKKKLQSKTRFAGTAGEGLTAFERSHSQSDIFKLSAWTPSQL